MEAPFRINTFNYSLEKNQNEAPVDAWAVNSASAGVSAADAQRHLEGLV